MADGTTEYKAFISYRRDDAFLPPADAVDVDAEDFVEKVEAYLKQIGFSHVFVDRGMPLGKEWLGVIFDEISKCDLFVPLIGRNWDTILQERQKGSEPEKDVLVAEIELALSLDKTILPLLVDRRSVPDPRSLPPKIAPMTRYQVAHVETDADDDANRDQIKGVFNNVVVSNKLGARWMWSYCLIALFAWLFTAVAPNVVGIMEFSYESWRDIALIWGGLYIWPIVFIPFALAGLFRPITSLVEQIVNAKAPGRRFRYIAPFVIAVGLGALGATIDISADEVVWTVKPAEGQGLACPENASVTDSPGALTAGHLLCYDRFPEGYLTELYLDRYKNIPHWLKSDGVNWPNVFFYLTFPMTNSIKADPNYKKERVNIVRLYQQSEEYSGALDLDFVRTYTFYFYYFSMFILVSLMAIGIVSLVYFTLIGIEDPNDQTRLLKTPVENAYLGIMFAFISLLAWYPFRVITTYYKSLICSSDIEGQECIFNINNMFNDMFLSGFL
ncbi:MAG: toll/interleukin-1 receptor domain-containing protein, partial [Pseudomonadota bacterium]